MVSAILALVTLLGRYTHFWFFDEIGVQGFLQNMSPAGIKRRVPCEPLGTRHIPEPWGISLPVTLPSLTLLSP